MSRAQLFIEQTKQRSKHLLEMTKAPSHLLDDSQVSDVEGLSTGMGRKALEMLEALTNCDIIKYYDRTDTLSFGGFRWDAG